MGASRGTSELGVMFFLVPVGRALDLRDGGLEPEVRRVETGIEGELEGKAGDADISGEMV